MKITAAAFALFAVSLNLGAAGAQTRVPADKAQPAPQTHYQAPTHFDFDDDVVEGAMQRPDGDSVTGIKKPLQESLLKPRQSFVPELLKTVESL